MLKGEGEEQHDLLLVVVDKVTPERFEDLRLNAALHF